MGARRLLVGRLEMLALGGVLPDLAEYLVPLCYQPFDTIANLVFHYLSRSILKNINCGYSLFSLLIVIKLRTLTPWKV